MLLISFLGGRWLSPYLSLATERGEACSGLAGKVTQQRGLSHRAAMGTKMGTVMGMTMGWIGLCFQAAGLASLFDVPERAA